MSIKPKKLILLVLAIVSIGAIGLLIIASSNANKLIAQFKPQLEESISGILGSKVTVGEIKVQVFPETAFNLSSLEVEQKSEALLTPKFKNLSIKLELIRLLKGELAFKEILLDSPEILIKKLETKIQAQNSHSSSPGQDAANQNSALSKANPSSPIDLDLRSLKINNATIEVQDIAANKSYKVSDLDISTAVKLKGSQVSFSDFELSGMAQEKVPLKLSFPILTLLDKQLQLDALSASLFEQKIFAGLTLNLDKKAGEVKVNSDSLSASELLQIARVAAPSIPEMSVSGKFIPNFKAIISGPKEFSAEGSVTIQDLSTIQAGFEISKTNGSLQLKARSPDSVTINSSDLSLLINNKPVLINLALEHQAKQIKITETLISLLGGQIKLASNINLENKNFDLEVKGSQIQIAEAMTLLKKGNLHLSGNILDLSGNLTGVINQELPKTLRGTAKASIADGAIKGFNLAGIVLKAVKNLPFLVDSLYSKMPDSSRSALDSSDTAFSSLTADLEFISQGISLQKLNLESPLFKLEAQGLLSSDFALDLNATIYFSQSISSSLVASTEQLKYALNDRGLLVLPLKISGNLPKVIVLPNLNKLIEVSGKNLLQEKAGEAAKNLLKGKGLGGILGF